MQGIQWLCNLPFAEALEDKKRGREKPLRPRTFLEHLQEIYRETACGGGFHNINCFESRFDVQGYTGAHR